MAERFLRRAARSTSKASCAPASGRTQSGNDRYSTEVSVGGMGGVLTMLDGAPVRRAAAAASVRAAAVTGAAAVGSGGGNDCGGGKQSGGGDDGGGSGGSGFADDLDDDIPF